MNPDITHIRYGPPGTGKTTDLLNVTESLMDSGVPSEQICFVAFTRKAATEARERARAKFKLEDKQLPWFRTLHSLAFFQLGLSKGSVMGAADYLKLCGQLGLSITFKGASEDGTIVGMSKGDRLFFAENMARAQMMTLKKYWEDHPNEDMYWYELARLRETMLAYKKANGKQDFTDIIYSFNNSPVAPDIRALIVDEAQDLTPLQWEMVEHLAKDVEEIYIAGDDDQAIFKWAGADVDKFISLPGHRQVLPKSYRVSKSVQKVAETIISRVGNRVAKSWEPTPHEGAVNFVSKLEQVDMGTGTWLLLARNVFLLQAYNDHCIQMGYVFDSHIGSPVRGLTLQAIVAWEKLRKGEEIPAHQVKKVYELMMVKEKVAYGFKTRVEELPDERPMAMAELRKSFGLLTDKIWHEALDKVPVAEREYFLTALRRGEKLLREPRIRINTIHGVKGGEADNVVIQTDMAQRTWEEYSKNQDDEHRVWYVAVTRARHSLYVVSPTTNRNYVI